MTQGRAAAPEVEPASLPARRVDLKTKLLTVFVVLTNVLGNFAMSWGMKHQAADLGLSPLALHPAHFQPWVLLGTTLLIFWLLSRMTLLGWADLSYVLPVTSIGYVLNAVLGKYFFGEAITWQRWMGTAAHRGRHRSGRTDRGKHHPDRARGGAMRWAPMNGGPWSPSSSASTALGDLLQSFEMKRHAVAVDDLRPDHWARTLRSLARRWPLVLAVFLMAISFFAFMKLLTVADLSFAVPATAASVVLETVLARVLLKESVTALRWAGAFCVACGVALLAM